MSGGDVRYATQKDIDDMRAELDELRPIAVHASLLHIAIAADLTLDRIELEDQLADVLRPWRERQVARVKREPMTEPEFRARERERRCHGAPMLVDEFGQPRLDAHGRVMFFEPTPAREE